MQHCRASSAGTRRRGWRPIAHAWVGVRGTSAACALQGILREHTLPRLARLGSAPLWLHWAEQAVAFERALAPLRGLPAAAADEGGGGADLLGGEAVAEPWAEGSCLELLATQPVRCCCCRPPLTKRHGFSRRLEHESSACTALAQHYSPVHLEGGRGVPACAIRGCALVPDCIEIKYSSEAR
jgi:hypothetical protein